MTIIIPYRDEVHHGLELRYSLRSIEKYLTGWDQLVLIGDKPLWYTGVWIPKTDQPARKEFNIYSKILLACEHEIVSEDFLFYNDDHFLLKPLSVKDIKYWHNGLLENELKRNITARYRADVKRTIEELSAEALNFDIHVPIIYNKKHFEYLFRNETKELCIKSFYANSWEREREFMNDCKIDGQLSKEQIRKEIECKLFFSTGTMLCTEMVEILGELFPEKCNFE